MSSRIRWAAWDQDAESFCSRVYWEGKHTMDNDVRTYPDEASCQRAITLILSSRTNDTICPKRVYVTIQPAD